MGQRVAHAHDQLDCCRGERGDVADVARDRLDRQAARALRQFGEEPTTEVDGQHLEAEARQRDGLESGATAEVHRHAALRHDGDAEPLEQRLLLDDLRLELAEHTRVVAGQHLVVVLAHGGHDREWVIHDVPLVPRRRHQYVQSTLKSAKITAKTHPIGGPVVRAVHPKPSAAVADQRILSDSISR